MSSSTRPLFPLAPNRRALLFGAGAGLAVSRLVAGSAIAAPKGHTLKVGLASYSLRAFSIEKVIAICKDLGVTSLTNKDMHLPREPDKLEQAKKAYADAGIDILGAGVIYMKNDEAVVRKDFEYARAAGVPMIVAAPDPDAFDLVEKMIKEFNMPVAVHNHGPEDKHFPAPADVMKLIARRDKRFGVCMDIGHTVRAGADPIRCVSECGPRLFDLHIKDLKDKNDKNSQTETGKGIIDVAGLLKVLVKKRFAGHVALEYEINKDAPVPGIKESLAYIRGVLAGLKA
ncbi:MAG: sugar phosphate isomerase/epimerase [Deltaproteobacteria bacterium]|nr:sugar phosphate isomerase/epimerase [Deltaproteobacteria bacterium]